MHIAILGRQPELSIAELERLYGSDSVHWFSDISATIHSQKYSFENTAGSQKAGKVVAELRGDWHAISIKIVKAYLEAWSDHEGKITLGISAYGFSKTTARDVQKTGIILKKKLREKGVNIRLVPNEDTALNTAKSHHNKLGLSDNKVELLVVRNSHGSVIVAESVGSQNITALARRDQERPKRDAFVGMLPPKLAHLMVNLAAGNSSKQAILDPFCGTGVLLQEALLAGHTAYGSDLSEKMVEYSKINLEWLSSSHKIKTSYHVEYGDATEHIWKHPINCIASEAYLGQPFSAPPSPKKLQEVRKNCNYIISTFLKNIHAQLESGITLCVAVPAWRSKDNSFTHLPLINRLGTLGYKNIQLSHVRHEQLIYFRDDQVVARQLLLIEKI